MIDRPHLIRLASTETRLDGSPFDTELEFTFEPQGGKTLVTMVQRGFPSLELRDEHLRGVPNAFARLERAVRWMTLTDHCPGRLALDIRSRRRFRLTVLEHDPQRP